MDNLVDLVKSIIDKIDLEIKVSEVVANRLTVCNTLFLTNLKVVIIDGLEYTITDFSLNSWLEVTPKGHTTDVPLDTTIVLAPSITFLHGAPMSTNTEYQQLSLNTTDKTPFIWLVEPYSFDDQPIESSLDVEFTAKLLFLDWILPAESNKNHNDLVIKPMNNLKEAFIDVINEDYNFKRLESTKSITRPRFGVYTADKGPKQKIIDEDLSGVEFDLDLKVYDVSQCCTQDEIILNTFVSITNTDLTYNKTVANGGSLILPDITHTDSDSLPVILPAQTAMICTPTVVRSGIAYRKPLRTGQTTSYEQFDEGDNLANGVFNYVPPEYPVSFAILDTFTTLLFNNEHGNKDRLTDSEGGQIFGPGNGSIVGVMTDHYTNLDWYLEESAPMTWIDALTSIEASTDGGFSDWRMPNMKELYSFYDMELSSRGYNYEPIITGAINNPSGWLQFQSSQTSKKTTTQIFYIIGSDGRQVTVNKTSTMQSIKVRNHS